jgi:hypothetical protein
MKDEDLLWIGGAVLVFFLLGGTSILSGLTSGVSANTVALANINANQQNQFAGDATSVLTTVLNDYS